MKRYRRILLMTLFGILALGLPVFAREMTIEELGEEAIKQEPGTSYIYVIGEYAFTSEHTLTTQDVMLAAKSIQTTGADGETNTEDIYGKMAIHTINGKYNNLAQLEGWQKGDNVIGTTELPDRLNIRYIDYNFISEPTKINVDLEKAEETTYKEKLKSDFNFDGGNTANSVGLDLKNGKLTGMIKRNTEVIGFADSEKTGYYFSFVVEVPNATEQTTVKLVGNKTTEVTYDRFDVTTEGNEGIVCLWALDPNSANKTITITVDLDGESGKQYGPTTQTIDWSDLDFQKESAKTQISAVSGENGKKTLTQADQDLIGETWKYDFDNAGEMILTKENNKEHDYTLTGTVKQQKQVKAGFKEETGYYAVLKIYGPTDESLKNKWTVQLREENGDYKDPITPSPADYQNGFFVVLFKLKNTEEADKKLAYKIDWDGTEDYYLPYEETIDYSGLQFAESHEVKLQGSSQTVTVWEGEEIPADEILKIRPSEQETPYRNFAYWMTEDGTKVEGTTVNDDIIDEDGTIKLIPHWNLDADKFVGAIIEDLNKEEDSKTPDFHEKFIFEKDPENSNNINIKIVNPETKLTEMNNTSISSAMAYVLLKSEIQEITFEVNEANKKTFNKEGEVATAGISMISELPEGHSELKGKIQAGIEALYDDVLGTDQDQETTLSAMAIGQNSSFKIRVEKFDSKTVSLTNTEYTFTFESNVAVVNTEQELKEALANKKITDILLAKDIQLTDENKDQTNSHTLFINLTDANRNVTIKSLTDREIKTISDEEKTTEGENDITPVIQVDAGNVTFENLKIKGATRAITVKSGATVTAKNVNAIASQDAAFDVESGANFTGIDLKYTKDGSQEKESYHYPTVCGTGTVKLQKTEDGEVVDAKATAIANYKRIQHKKDGTWQDSDFRDPETGNYYADYVENGVLKNEYSELIGKTRKEEWDKLRNTDHTHYYLKEENSKYYQINFWDSRVRLIITRYYAKGDEIIPPNDNAYKESDVATDFHFFIKAYEDTKAGKTYVHDGWAKSSEIGSEKVEITLPEDVNTVGVYWTRFVEGYRVKIPMDVGEAQKTGVFGIPLNTKEMKIKDLMEFDPEFATAFNTLKEKAGSQKIVDKSNHTTEITEETVISSNMELEIIETLQLDAVMQMNVASNIQGLMAQGNSISGTLTTQSNDGKFYLPVTLTSENFQNNISTVTVTAPNGGEPKVYTYNSNNENGIMTTSTTGTTKTMTLQLEAIKKSNIASGNKVYKIAVDVDGKEANQYAIQNYTIDYNGVETLAEVINEAAKNTQEANSLTMIKDNKIKGGVEKFTYKYDKNKNYTYSESSNGDEKEYTFKLQSVIPSHNGPIMLSVKNKPENYIASEKSRPELNDWIFANFFTSVRMGSHEISLLQDVIKDKQSIEAIEKVRSVEEKEHTYEVIINKEKVNNWLNNVYLDGSKTEKNGALSEEDSNTVKLEVVLDAKEKYLVSVKTTQNFSITTTSGVAYEDNKIDIKFLDVGNTIIQEPTKFLAKEGEELTQEDFKKYYEECKKWHKENTGADIYEGE